LKALFTAGDGVGGSGHKFSSGSHAEGRIAAKQMVRYAKDFADFTPTLKQSKEELVDLVYKPVRTFLDNYELQHRMSISTPTTSNPNGMMYRLMKATHEYGAGTATYYQTTSKNLEIIMDLLATMREDCEKLAAGEPARTDARLGNRTPHLDGGIPPAPHPVPQRNPLPGFLLSGRLSGTG
jgi:adenylylsulfate reductase subunit A